VGFGVGVGVAVGAGVDQGVVGDVRVALSTWKVPVEPTSK
jgi:hypothetical protein